MHPPDAGIRAASRSQRLEAAQQLLKWSSLPSSRLLCLPPSCAMLCPAPGCAKGSSQPRMPYNPSPPSQLCRLWCCCYCAWHCLSACGTKQAAPLTPIIRPLISKSTALPATLLRLQRHRASLFIWRSIRIDYSYAAFNWLWPWPVRGQLLNQSTRSLKKTLQSIGNMSLFDFQLPQSHSHFFFILWALTSNSHSQFFILKEPSL